MTQDKPELLAGTSNFPRTDIDNASRRKAAVAVAEPDGRPERGDNVLSSVATRSVAQLAESSKALAPFLKGVSTELKAIRTGMQPGNGILKSLQNIERHLAAAGKGADKKAAVNGGFDDRRLNELTQSMSRSVVITDNIAQNTAYIAHALDNIVRMQVEGGGRRGRERNEGPVEAVEERRNKRLSKTFADSLDNSRMAKEMERGFKKLSAMQALNSFANLGQGGGAGMLNGLVNSLGGIVGKSLFSVLTNPLVVGAGIGTALGLITSHMIDKRSQDVNERRNNAWDAALKERRADLDQINELQRLAKAQGKDVSLQDLNKMVSTTRGYEDTLKYKKLADENAKKSGKYNQKLRGGKIRDGQFEDLDNDQKATYIASLHQRGLIDAPMDTSALALGIFKSEEENAALKYWNEVNSGAGVTRNKDGSVSGTARYASETTKGYASNTINLTALKKEVGYTGDGITGNAQQAQIPISDHNLYAKMDEMMKRIHPGLTGYDLAKLIEHESAGTWDPAIKTGERPGGQKVGKDDIQDPENNNRYRPSTAIGVGQWTRKAMKDMKGHGVNTRGSIKDYYESFRNNYPTVEKQLPLFEEHWRSKGVLGKVRGLSREDALKVLYVSHFAGGGAIKEDGTVDEKTSQEALTQNNGMTNLGYYASVNNTKSLGKTNRLDTFNSIASSNFVPVPTDSTSTPPAVASTGVDVLGDATRLIEDGKSPKSGKPLKSSRRNSRGARKAGTTQNINNIQGGSPSTTIIVQNGHDDLGNG